MSKRILLFSLTIAHFFFAKAQTNAVAVSSTSPFNNSWQFIIDADTAIKKVLFEPANTSIAWQNVTLPHTAHIEPVIKVKEQWQGTCFYRKFFTLNKAESGKHIAVRLDAAMGEAEIYLNGKFLMNHKGGFLPFEVDISREAIYGAQNCLLVRLNNRDNPEIPPGKPIKDLDFNFYGGLYRNAWLIKKNALYITDAVTANRINGGGVLLHYDSITAGSALLQVKVDIKNDGTIGKNARLKVMLYDPSRKLVKSSVSSASIIAAGSTGSIVQTIAINNPKIWTPALPQLYKVVVMVMDSKGIADSVTIKSGIRKIGFKPDGFYLNDQKYVLRGTNRHQEYPYIGYALSDNAQYRDAFKIKQAGFDFVRCSHYPPSPAFLDACDQLGIFVMDSTPGWQFFGNEAFQQNSLQNIADMLHRDRNHPAIILWEASLNETDMKPAYMQKAHAMVHKELPYPDTYTCGWMDTVYDVFIPARQHAKAPFYWKNYKEAKPIFIAEYGDWEYYAQNAGFNQTAYEGLKAEEKTSRQLRADGDKRMMRQALNFQEAHNDNLNGSIAGDASWLMFDYKRGYATDIQSSGVMDIFRLPKFVYYFYQSQRDVNTFKPMVYIASNWKNTVDGSVTVYSNCDHVELFLNGRSMGRQAPDTGTMSNNLSHPPFTFKIAYAPGTLTAKGYIKGQTMATAEQRTPGAPAKIKLTVDLSGRALQAGVNDAVFVYASVVDQNDTLVPDAVNTISLEVGGDATLTGGAQINAEGGIASFLLKAGKQKGLITLKANSVGLKNDLMVIKAN